jgi:hypothetical protein
VTKKGDQSLFICEQVIKCPCCGKLITPDKKPGHHCFRQYLDGVDKKLHSLEKAEHVKHRGVFVSMLGF